MRHRIAGRIRALWVLVQLALVLGPGAASAWRARPPAPEDRTLYIDLLEAQAARAGFPGRDTNGSIWSGGAPDAVDDFTTYGSHSSKAWGLRAAPAWRSHFLLDDADPRWSNLEQLCRDPDDGFSHCGPGGPPSCQPIHDERSPGVVVHREAASDRYRLWPHTGFVGCSGPGPWLAVGPALPRAQATGDEMQPFSTDGVHPTTFGSLWIAQKILLDVHEAHYPGSENAVPNGFLEEDCAAVGWTASGAASLDPRDYDPHDQRPSQLRPLLGRGCRLRGDGVALSALADVTPDAAMVLHAYVVVDGRLATPSVTLRDAAGGAIPPAASYVDVGGVWEPAAGLHPGQCHGQGCRVLVEFRAPSSGRVRVEIARDGNADLGFDEVFLKRSRDRDPTRLDPKLPDGTYAVRFFSDSRGNPQGEMRVPQALDYLQLDSPEAPLRPGIQLTSRVVERLTWQSGKRLGNSVGPEDRDLTYTGARRDSFVEDDLALGDAEICMAFFGVNDFVGGKARPGDGGVDYQRFALQVRGFAALARRYGCRPYFVLDTTHRADTTVGFCRADDGTTQNCGVVMDQALRTLLHGAVDVAPDDAW